MQFFLQHQGHLILRTLFLLDVPDGKQQCHRVIFVFLGLPSFSPRGLAPLDSSQSRGTAGSCYWHYLDMSARLKRGRGGGEGDAQVVACSHF